MERLEDGKGRLMRMPIQGGDARLVLAGDFSFHCGSGAATSCILSEVIENHLTFFALDPLKGQGRQLASTDIKEDFYNWSVSPDGNSIAVVDGSNQVRIVSAEGGEVRRLTIAAWSYGQFVSWTAEGTHLYLTGERKIAAQPDEWTLLETDLVGNFKVLIRLSSDQGWLMQPVPSPDGRYLVYGERTWPSSVAMLEAF
jgi:Tol biopolymer transport system component